MVVIVVVLFVWKWNGVGDLNVFWDEGGCGCVVRLCFGVGCVFCCEVLFWNGEVCCVLVCCVVFWDVVC